MIDTPFKKIPERSATRFCEDIELDSPARQLLTQELSPESFLNILIDRELFADAVRFLARALPKRESTWWACLCARSALGESVPELVLGALQAAESWVYEPTEERRRVAYAAAQAAEFSNPASWAAMAAFWSGGSMAPSEVPPVPPTDDLTGKAVAGAVMLAAVQTEPERAPEKYRLFIQRGIDVARGGNGRLE